MDNNNELNELYLQNRITTNALRIKFLGFIIPNDISVIFCLINFVTKINRIENNF